MGIVGLFGPAEAVVSAAYFLTKPANELNVKYQNKASEGFSDIGKAFYYQSLLPSK